MAATRGASGCQKTSTSAPSAASASGTAGRATVGTMYGKKRAPNSQSRLITTPPRIADHPDAVLLRGDGSAFRRERVSARDWQRLRRGQFSAQDELDLHGANALQAETLLARFLGQSTGAGLGCVRIIHGKGGGDGVPVLKNLVDRALRQRGEVLAFHSAPPSQGGTGALLVLLARR